MFCPNCGNRVPDGSPFCAQCGAKVQEQAVQVPSAPVAAPIPNASRRSTSGSAKQADGGAGGILVKAVAVAIAAAAAWVVVSWATGVASTIDDVIAGLSVLESTPAVAAAVAYAVVGVLCALVSLRTIAVVLRPIGQSPYPSRALSHALACGIALLMLALAVIALPAVVGASMPLGFSSQHAEWALALGVEPAQAPTFIGALLVIALAALGRFGLRAHLGDKYGMQLGPKPAAGTYEAERWAKAKRRRKIVAIVIAAVAAVLAVVFAVLVAMGTIQLPDLPWQRDGEYNESTPQDGSDALVPAPVQRATDEEMAREATTVYQAVGEIDARYADGRGYIAQKDITAVLAEVEAYAQANQDVLVESYEATDAAVFIKLTSGLTYAYEPRVEGVKAGGAEVYVRTYEPYAEDQMYSGVYNTAAKQKYYDDLEIKPSNVVRDGLVDGDGLYLARNTPKLSYSRFDEANDDQVTVDLCKSFGPNQVILWDGHGNWSSSAHGMIGTGEKNDGRSGQIVDPDSFFKWVFGNLSQYRDDIEAGRIIVSSSERLIVTTLFFDYYYHEGDLAGTTVFLSACRCMMDDEMAKVLTSKGARAVIGYTRSVSIVYDGAVRDEMVYQLSKGATYGDALASAQEKYGEYDPFYADKTDSTNAVMGSARAKVYPAEAGLLSLVPSESELEKNAAGTATPATVDTREIVMALDVSASMEGTPLDETVKATNRFVDKVFAADVRMSLISYSSTASTLVAHSAGAGRVRSAVSSLTANGQTNIEGVLKQAKALFDESASNHKVLVLMSDGLPNVGATGDSLTMLADDLKSNGVLIYTLGFFQNSKSADKTAGQSLMTKIASPGCHYEVDSEEVLDLFFGDIADIINGTRYMYVTVACPVEVSVTCNGETLESNSEGKSARTSFGTITYINNVDAAGNVVHNEDGTIDQVKVIRLREGASYHLKIKGTGTGTMDYVVGYLDENGDYTDFRTFSGIAVSTAMSARSTVAVGDQTSIEIDDNGDGVSDRMLIAGANGVGRERDSSAAIKRALLVVGVVAAGIVVVWIGLLVRRLTKGRR